MVKQSEDITMWLKVFRRNISLLIRKGKGTTSIEQKNGNGSVKGNKTNNNGTEVNRNEDQNGSDNKSQAKKKPVVPGGGPLLQQTEVSTSQMDFFRMLDEKIENGPDYDEAMDSNVMRRWEATSIEVGIRNNSKERNMELKGRVESAPVFVTANSRTANRVDGLQDCHSTPPNMPPRHVLESITQSPTQSLKHSPSPSSSSMAPMAPMGQQQPRIIKAQQQQLTPINGEFLNQQALFREQYLQQTGMAVPFNNSASPPGRNVLRNNNGNSYVQQFQVTQSPHFSGPRKRGFNAAQTT